MKSWNLLSFDEVMPNVLSFVDKEATVSLPCLRKRKRAAPQSTSLVTGVGTAVLVAAITLTNLQVNVFGSDHELRLTSAVSISNIQDDPPPLKLLFGGSHEFKWDAKKEQEMLERAAAAVSASTDANNRVNLIHAVLRENLPKDREDADDLASLGIKLG